MGAESGIFRIVGANAARFRLSESQEKIPVARRSAPLAIVTVISPASGRSELVAQEPVPSQRDTAFVLPGVSVTVALNRNLFPAIFLPAPWW